jgi:AcrR family transcriptional regulator
MRFKSRREEYSEATRRALVRAGRKLFATQGYAETSVSEIVKAARLTGGALYHHFRDKKQLFEAVAEEIEQEIMQKADQAAAAHLDPWARLHAGIEAVLDASMTLDVQRIGFLEAPAVLGLDGMRAMELRYGYGKLRQSLERAMNAGVMRRHSVDLLGPILLGSLTEAAMAIARDDNPPAARKRASEILKELLSGLRIDKLER